MNLPNANSATIPDEKIISYLLNITHRRGGSKAKLLNMLGYDVRNWQVLANDIRQQHLAAEIVETHDSMWGKRYEIVAPLTGPSGDTVMFRSIWQFDLGTEYPRLITMYPE
jgi:hypothetical protein